MSPVDLADVTAYTYTYLMNGHSPGMNWTALFNPGETIRLRFINASSTTNYDVRIPGLDMEVVMADGKAVSPVPVSCWTAGTYQYLRGFRPMDFSLKEAHMTGTLQNCSVLAFL
jgi:hypothetical protein